MSITLRITDAGRAALVNAAHDGTNAVRIASAGVSPTAITAAGDTAALPGEVKRITTVSGSAIAADVIHLVVRDESADTYTVRSFALYLADGTLFASYGQPTPIIEKSSAALLLLAVDATLVDIAAEHITFGNANFLNPPATTDTAGVVELATETEAMALADAVRALTPKTMASIFTAANILARLRQTDGAGSGLDADLLDGFDSNAVLLDRGSITTTALDSALANGTYRVVGSTNSQSLLVWTNASSVGTVQMYFSHLGDMQWRNRTDGGSWSAWRTIWHSLNDGAGSGLDADLIDGFDSAAMLVDRGAVTTASIDSAVANGTYRVVGASNSQSLLAWTNASSVGTVQLYFSHLGDMQWRNKTDGGIWSAWRTIWHSLNDGAGSGLDADMLDGFDSNAVMLDRGSIASAAINGAVANGSYRVVGEANSQSLLAWTNASSVGTVQLYCTHLGDMQWRNKTDGANWSAWRAIWHSQNDGAGSGLDADLLDGQDGSYYANIVARLGYTPLDAGSYSAGDVRAKLLSVDGAGSGLDADLLDGRHASEFALLSGAAFSGPISTPGPVTAYVAGRGGAKLEAPGDTNPGYVGLYDGAGNRVGFVGYASGSRLTLSAERSMTGWAVIGDLLIAGAPAWHAANDGAGSGMDADLLDGRHASEFSRVTAFSSAANGYRVHADGYKECWGSTFVGANSSAVIGLPVAHSAWCVPTGSCSIAQDEASIGVVQVNGAPPDSFTVRNRNPVATTFFWHTRGV